MTTVVDHAAAAEYLLEKARDEAGHGIVGLAQITVACAQVHATLALTKATEEVAESHNAWLRACNGDFPPQIAIRR